MSFDAAYFADSLAAANERPVQSLGISEDELAKPSATTSEAESSDELLLEQLGKQNREALALLFRRYARMVRAVAFRILRDDAEAEDLTQEVFLFVFCKAALFNPSRGSARTWIVQVTYHRAIDRRRHLSARRFYQNGNLEGESEEAAVETLFYEQSVEGALGSGLVKRINEALTSDQRTTLELYFTEGYTFEEIGRRVGQSAGNARNHYYRGLERIRRLIFQKELRAR